MSYASELINTHMPLSVEGMLEVEPVTHTRARDACLHKVMILIKMSFLL
jgi:hypothetical protein